MSTPDSVDEESPWLGLASFTEETRALFFGREQEVAELERRVQRKLLTVLFGKSGLGKTSILQAGLVPSLRARGYFPVYLRIDYGHESAEPGEQIKQGINRAAGSADGEAGNRAAVAGEWTQTGVTAPGESIWEFLHHRDDVLKDKSGATLTPLLIFDQFEELFTLAQSDEFGRARAARFIEELADLVENRPPKALEAKLDTDESIAERFDFSRSDYRVVIALREDYLAPLESLKKQMPSLSQNRLRLAPMTGSQALEAVLQPGNRLHPSKPLVSEEVAEAIVRFVAGGSELANAEVEPSLLSLICRELNEQRIAQGRTEISLDLLAGSHESILSSFYERALADQPASVRKLIEDELLTESGYRENLAEESLLRRFQAAGAAPDALGKLVNRRLLRIEERLDVRRVELTHDVLTGVVKVSRDQRHEREAREATERAFAEQRTRENAARRALRRARAVAAGCTLLAAVAIAAAIFAFVSVKRARRAELAARQTRAISEQARGQAEGLLGFLTDDFVSELETFGRYQTIAELSQREIDYFQHLPASLQDPQTVRAGALALVNHAKALQFIGDPGAAAENASAAIALLEPLARTEKSDATSLVLGRAYTGLGGVLHAQEDFAKANFELRRAVDLLQPVAERAGASAAARQAYLDALVALRMEDGDSFQHEKERQVAQRAMRVGRALGAPRHGGVAVDTAFANAAAGLVSSLVRLGHNDEARRVAEDALATVDQILSQHPQYGEALLDKVLLERRLASIAVSELDPAATLQFAMQGEQATLTLARIEPGNVIYANQLGILYGMVGGAMWSAGRLREATISDRKSVDTFAKVSAGFEFGVSNLSLTVTQTTLLEAQLGDSKGVAATAAEAGAVLSQSALRKPGHADDDARALLDAAPTFAAAVLDDEQGHFAMARHIEHQALALLQARRPAKNSESTYIVIGINLVSGLEGRTDYALGDFAAAAQAEETALQANKSSGGIRNPVSSQRSEASDITWLSMALAREGKREESAQTIAPVVTMYRALEKRNHGDQWLPLEYAEALYAQALTDEAHRAALLREAAQRVDHLIPAIARLHDTRAWRARIEAAQRRAGH